MHTTQRLLSLIILGLVLLPFAVASAFTAADERFKQTESIRSAIENVAEQQAETQQHVSRKEQGKRMQQKAEEQLEEATQIKLQTRARLAEAVRQEKVLQERGIKDTSTIALLRLFEQEKDRLRLFLRSAHVAYLGQGTLALGTLLGQTVVGNTLGERTEKGMRHRAALDVRAELLGMLRTAQHLPETLAILRTEHQAALRQYHAAQAELDLATQQMHASAVSQEEIQRIVAEVQGQILKMQSELARIDARLRRKAERALIKKGLLSPKEGEYTSGKIVGNPASLLWPVSGRITAGFYDASYAQFFGVPHKAIDIAVPQGSDVYAAADGVVFLARHGGRTGYSYVLIGHQGGTATLYGHLSKIYVASGQDIYRGQKIGLSGGAPGTIGAGPMTTGAHLHFEVIQNGKHVNPVSVLP